MLEFEYFDGYDYVKFYLVKINDLHQETKVTTIRQGVVTTTVCKFRTVTVVVSYLGKITTMDFDLFENKNGLYFEYGPSYEEIYIDDFEEVA